MALYKDIRFFNGSPIEIVSGTSPIITGSTFKQDIKGYAIETSNGKYLTYPSQILPNNAFSCIVWAKLRNSHVVGTDYAGSIGYNNTGTYGPIISHGYFAFLGKTLLSFSDNNWRVFNYIPDKKWHCYIFTIPGAGQTDINNSQLFVDTISIVGATATSTTNQNSRSSFIYAGGSATTTGGCHISRIKVYDTVLTTQEIEKEQEEFNNARTLAKQKRGIVKQRINDLSMFKGTGAGQGLIFASNMQPKGNTLIDISGNNNSPTLTGGNIVSTKDGVYFPNSGYYKKTGFTGLLTGLNANQYTVSMRVKFNEVGREQHLVELNTTSPVNYQRFINTSSKLQMNGSSNTLLGSQVLLINKWYTINFLVKAPGAEIYTNGILDASNVNFTENINTLDLYIGVWNNSSLFKFNGEIADIRIHNRILTPTEIRQYSNSFILPTFTETFENEGADGSARVPTGWIKGSGSYCIKQITTNVISGGLRLSKGQKYLENLSAGTISFPNNWVNGAVEFSWYKGGDSNIISFYFINSNNKEFSNEVNSYWINSDSNEAIKLWKGNTSSVTQLIASANSYIQNFTWYTTRIERTNSGQFTLLIKGGNFVPTSGRNGFTLVSVLGGSGSNPVTDSTYNSSSYSVISCGVGDRITNIKFMDGIKQI